MVQQTVTDEVTGPKMVEAEPGSADDSLLTDEARAALVAATGAATAPETPAVAEEASPKPDDKPPEAPAPAAETAPAKEGEAWDEETVQGLEKLDVYLESQIAERSAEQRRGLDKTISRLQTESAAEIKALREEVRTTQINGVPEEEREALRNKWAHDDRMAEVVAREEKVSAYDADVARYDFLVHYREFGVTEADLLDKPVEELGEFCALKKAEHFERLAQGVGTKPAPASAKQGAPATQAKEEPKAPAGASAPSDVGGSPPPAKAPEFDKGQGRDAMLTNLGNLPVETIQRG